MRMALSLPLTIFIWSVEPKLMGLIDTNLPQWAVYFAHVL